MNNPTTITRKAMPTGPPILAKMYDKKAYISKRLLEVGLSKFELMRSEAQHLPSLLRDQEKIGGAISGRGNLGHTLIVATNKRIMILDYKPLFESAEDIAYSSVVGISMGHAGPVYTMTLFTRLGDFIIKYANERATKTFKNYVDHACIEVEQSLMNYNLAT